MQHVLHQVRQPPRLLDDDRHGLAPRVLPARPTELERLAEEEDLGERSAQLVRHAGGEVLPEPHQLLLRAGSDGAATAVSAGGKHEQAEQERQPDAGLGHHQPARHVRRKPRADYERARHRDAGSPA